MIASADFMWQAIKKNISHNYMGIAFVRSVLRLSAVALFLAYSVIFYLSAVSIVTGLIISAFLSWLTYAIVMYFVWLKNAVGSLIPKPNSSKSLVFLLSFTPDVVRFIFLPVPTRPAIACLAA